jgi:D-lactate dehydrogenase (cytochrome)
VRQRGEDAVAVMRSIKHALDPQDLLNPGRVLA